MKRARGFGARTRLGVVAVALAAFAACGGGGGGGGPDLIDLTAANRDTVAHATAGSLMALGVSTSVPIFGGTAGVARHEWLMRIGTARERPQGLVPTPPQNCAISGTATVTYDDSNNNGILLEIGEPATVVFNRCQDTAQYVLDGTAVLTFTGGSATSFSATMGMTQLKQEATNLRHAMTVDGNLALSCSLSSSSMRCTSTATGPVRTAIHTHQFDDTVTLLEGFVEDSTFDDSTGHTLTTLQGTIDSAAAGGAVSVATEAAIASLDSDAYPHEGTVRISGSRGVMRISVLSATQVKIDLDSNDDGMFESSEIEDWDWVL